jgi:RimJ/RimL family protein N-acetyltransferase
MECGTGFLLRYLAQDFETTNRTASSKKCYVGCASAELSYFIDNSSERQGFATEAISEILRVALEQLDFKRIFVRIISSNQGSIALANKLGFKHEGLHRNAFRCGFGELHDVHYFSVTTEDFRKGFTNL